MSAERVGNVMYRPENLTCKTFDVVIVGGGPASLYTTEAIRELDPTVQMLVVEQNDTLGGSASYASLQQFRYYQGEKVVANSVAETVEWYKKLSEKLRADGESNTSLIDNYPYLFLAGNQKQLTTFARRLKENVSWGFGKEAQILSPEEMLKQFPFITGELAGALLYPQAGRLDFDRAIAEITKTSPNATFALGTQATRVLVDKDKVTGIETNMGTVKTKRVVLAEGPFMLQARDQIHGHLTHKNGLVVPIFSVYQRETFATSVKNLPPHTNVFIISPSDAYVHLRVGEDRGEGLYGYSNPEQGETTRPQQNPPANDEIFPALVYAKLGEAMPHLYGNDNHSGPLATTPKTRRAGYYVQTRDGLPFAGETQVDGLYILSGLSHTGVMTGYSVAKTLARDILGQPNTNPYALNRKLDKNKGIYL